MERQKGSTRYGNAWSSELNPDSLFISQFIFQRFLITYIELKRIWVEGGDPSGVGNFSLKTDNSIDCACTCQNHGKLDSPILPLEIEVNNSTFNYCTLLKNKCFVRPIFKLVLL